MKYFSFLSVSNIFVSLCSSSLLVLDCLLCTGSIVPYRSYLVARLILVIF